MANPSTPSDSNPALGTAADPLLVSITDAIVAAHPELAQVRSLYKSGDYAGALNLLYSTDYYKNTSPTVNANEQVKLNQPGVYQQTIADSWLPTLKSYAVQQGFQISDANLQAIAQKAYDLGLTPTSPGTLQLFQGKDASGQPYITGIVGGAASTTRQNLATAVADYGVPYNQDWVNSTAESVASGATTEQYWMDQIKTQAKSAFPAWSKQIDAGLTMKQIASPYITQYSNILGIDPAAITLDDKLLKQGLQGTDPTDPSAVPLWQFEQMVRQDPRWQTSKDAMDNLSNVGYNLAKQWGLMS
jgi:hypothetical protein